MENIFTVDLSTDLIYSPDDDGFYFQTYPEEKTSKIYATRSEAMKAYHQDAIEWEE